MRVKNIFPRGTAFKLKMVSVFITIIDKMDFVSEDKRYSLVEKAIKIAL